MQWNWHDNKLLVAKVVDEEGDCFDGYFYKKENDDTEISSDFGCDKETLKYFDLNNLYYYREIFY